MDGASKATLENEFGTTNDEEVIKQILEKGSLQESEVRSFLFLTSILPHPITA
jgi:ribosome maturation protein Sdo1